MKPTRILTLAVAMAALMSVPAVAAPGGQSGAHAQSHPTNAGSSHSSSPGPQASLPAKAKAYGHFCQTESKTHVAGQKGTPFSQCVTALAKLATGATHNPQAACSAASKKHIAGQKGTPFSQCVTAAAKLLASKS
jgi:hypothetical protein